MGYQHPAMEGRGIAVSAALNSRMRRIAPLLACLFARDVARLQRFNTFLFDEWQRNRDLTQSKGLIHRTFWRVKGVRWTIVAIDTLHFVGRHALGTRRSIGSREGPRNPCG